MFECALQQGELFKKIISAISDLVTEGNFQINSEHVALQGMDSSHVSLVALSLREKGFTNYRCDRDITLGINFGSLNKVLKCMGNQDNLKLKCHDDGDVIYICFENTNNKRISNFELKLMDIDQEQLGIPDTEYQVNISLNSLLFQKIIRDLSAIGDSVTISVNKTGVKFMVIGDIGKGDITLTGTVKKIAKNTKQNNNDNNDNKDNNDTDNKNNDNQGDNNNNSNNDSQNNTETPGNNDDDEDDDMKDKTDNVKPENKSDDIEVEAVDGDDNENDEDVYIVMDDEVEQTFALRYLTNFTKATILSKKVTLSMGAEVPLRCHYNIEDLGEIAYYLAPKIDDEDQ